jgi:hypothetical protein
MKYFFYKSGSIAEKQARRICLFMIFALIQITGCEREQPSGLGVVDCSKCYQMKPEWVRLNVVLTINRENPFVPLSIYVGNVEDNILDWQDTSYSKDYWVDVKPDRYYSVKAEYKKGTKTIFAIDGDKVKLDLLTADCDQDCYYQRGGNVDVRLK